ncbi:MAG TPA: hypothetical protein VFW22_16445 [Pseudolabrys sp.]|nr:hypothetical protein [Pseudolabrys sp.]
MALAPQPGPQQPPPQPPPSADRSSFYLWDLSGAPRANGPDDMPRSGFGEAVKSTFMLNTEDYAGASRRLQSAEYMPLVTALTEVNGKHSSDYFDPQSGMTFTNDVWNDVAELRRRNPGALSGFPASQAEFEAQQADKLKTENTRDQMIAARGPWGSNFTGGILSSLTDPVNMATAPIGGLEGGIARRIIGAGLVNAVTSLIQQPIVATERAARGEQLTLGEAAENVGSAFAGGALFHAGITEPAGALITRLLGSGRMTEAEQAAVHVLSREGEVNATSPFAPGAGTEAHAQKLQSVMNGMATGVAPSPAQNPAMAPRELLKAMIRHAENPTGDVNARNPRSSATGPDQMTDPTWIGLWKQRYGRGKSEADILAQRADPQVRDQLMNDLLAKNSGALARAGYPQTAGNMYLMHFAGEGGGLKILRADPNTPIEQLLGARAVEANPFLKGRTAGDVVQWAHARMGTASSPAIGAAGESDNAGWLQTQADMETLQADRMAETARARVDAATEADPTVTPWTAIDPREEPRSYQILDASAPDVAGRPSVEDLADQAAKQKKPYIPPDRTRPSDVLEFLSDHGGLWDEGHALSKGGLSKITGQRRSGMDWHLVRMPGAGSLVRRGGKSIEDAGELMWEAGYFRERPTEAEAIDLIDRAAQGEKIYPLHQQAEMNDIARAKAESIDYQQYANALSDHLGLPKDDPLFDDVMWRTAEHGKDMPFEQAANFALEDAIMADAERRGARYAQETGDAIDEWVPGFDDEAPYPVGRGALPPGFEDAPAAAGARNPEEVGGGLPLASGGPSEGDAIGQISGPASEALKGFDDPATGPAAEAQIQSLDHDIGMIAATPEGRAQIYDYGDEERGLAPRTVGDVIKALDREDAAIAAAEACMKPPAAPQ